MVWSEIELFYSISVSFRITKISLAYNLINKSHFCNSTFAFVFESIKIFHEKVNILTSCILHRKQRLYYIEWRSDRDIFDACMLIKIFILFILPVLTIISIININNIAIFFSDTKSSIFGMFIIFESRTRLNQIIIISCNTNQQYM